MKGAAELLGVTYASLYGRYRESFGLLRKKVDIVLHQPIEKFTAKKEKEKEIEEKSTVKEEEKENYEDSLMEVQSDLIVNNSEDLEENFVFEEDVVEKVHNHYSNNMF